MKKIMTVFIIMGCMLSFILPVKAKELTFNEIVDKFESTPLQGEHSMFEEIKRQIIHLRLLITWMGQK